MRTGENAMRSLYEQALSEASPKADDDQVRKLLKAPLAKLISASGAFANLMSMSTDPTEEKTKAGWNAYMAAAAGVMDALGEKGLGNKQRAIGKGVLKAPPGSIQLDKRRNRRRGVVALKALSDANRTKPTVLRWLGDTLGHWVFWAALRDLPASSSHFPKLAKDQKQLNGVLTK